ncbi:MAG: hypothetical protein DBX59_02590 [Bacillota bacterium]|nr:MAG: hypothetical protein DBX59_02590 [Bacillota bacterium]
MSHTFSIPLNITFTPLYIAKRFVLRDGKHYNEKKRFCQHTYKKFFGGIFSRSFLPRGPIAFRVRLFADVLHEIDVVSV